jgi:ketosteroid isomerase-like protein
MHTNARLIRTFHEALGCFYAGGDIEAVRTMLTHDVTWHVPGRSAIAGDHVGKNDVLDYFHRRRQLGRGTFKVTVQAVLANDRRAVLIAGGQADRDGKTIGWETVGIFRIEGRKIVECWLLPFDQYAFDEIWSQEWRQLKGHPPSAAP